MSKQTKLKLYLLEVDDYERAVAVVAKTAKQAKATGYSYLLEWSDYIDIRVHSIKNVIVPDNIIEPVVYEDCCGIEDWCCEAWAYSYDYCHDCKRHDEKRKEWCGEV